LSIGGVALKINPQWRQLPGPFDGKQILSLQIDLGYLWTLLGCGAYQVQCLQKIGRCGRLLPIPIARRNVGNFRFTAAYLQSAGQRSDFTGKISGKSIGGFAHTDFQPLPLRRTDLFDPLVLETGQRQQCNHQQCNG
jgi:hypothetical protein